MAIGRVLGRGLGWLAVGVAVLYAGDWGVYHARASQGMAVGTVTVHQFLTTPLKNRKEEYDYLGDMAMSCSRSIFPQGGSTPCWWLVRHTTVWE